MTTHYALPRAPRLPVIRYDLEFLGLCPCMVDVEIIDAKQGNTSIIVSAGTEVCTCGGVPGPMAGMNGPPLLTTSGGHPVTHLSGGAVPGIAAMAAAAAAVAQPMGTSAGGGGGYGGKVKPEVSPGSRCTEAIFTHALSLVSAPCRSPHCMPLLLLSGSVHQKAVRHLCDCPLTTVLSHKHLRCLTSWL